MEAEMRTIMEEDVVIVGGGIAGLATALALRLSGIRALVLERSDGLRTTGAALTLFPNAWLALDALGVSHKLTSVYPPLSKGSVTDIKTGVVQQISFNGGDGTKVGPRTIHRKALLEALAEELPPETIRFSSKVTSMDTQNQDGSTIAIVDLEDGAQIKAKVLIGCDGVHSVVARWLGLAEPVESGRWGVRGLAVFPQGHGLGQAVQQFVDVGTRAGYITLNEQDIYWFFTSSYSSKGEEKTLRDPHLIQRAILEDFGKELPESYLEIVRHSEISSVSFAPLMLRYPWSILCGNLHKGNVLVAGDAMHPMTPDLGQGGGSSLEDAVVLGRRIGESFIRNGELVPLDVKKAIEEYIGERRWRVAALVTGSYLSGWAQGSGSGWFMKLTRDVLFYKFIFLRLAKLVHYDCGRLPNPSEYKSKKD